MQKFKASGPVELVLFILVAAAAVTGAVFVGLGKLSTDTYVTHVLPELGVVLSLFGGAKAVRLHGQPVTLETVERYVPEIEAVAKALAHGDYKAALVAVERAIPNELLPSDAAEAEQQPPEPSDTPAPDVAAAPAEPQDVPAPQPVAADALAAAQATLAQAQAAGQLSKSDVSVTAAPPTVAVSLGQPAPANTAAGA